MEVQEVMALDLDQYPDLQGLTAEEINAQIPSYIDGMQSVENVKMVSVGKNLFDYKAFKYKGISGITKPINNGIECSTTDVGYFIEFQNHIPVKENTTYTFRANQEIISTTVSRFCSILYYSKNGELLGETSTNSSLTSGYVDSIFNTPTSTSYLVIRLCRANKPAKSNLKYSKIQLEQGTTPTSYEPYKESTMYLPVPLRQLPNGVSDTLDNEGNYVRRTEEYILQSGNIFGLYKEYTNIDYVAFSIDRLIGIKNINIGDAEATKVAISVTIPRRGIPNVNSSDMFWKHDINSTGAVIIWIPKNTYANLAEAQTALAGTKVIYELAEPITQKLNIPPVASFNDGTLMFENKRKYILQADDVTSVYTGFTNVDLARVLRSVFINYWNTESWISNAYSLSINGKAPYLGAAVGAQTTDIGKYSVTSSSSFLDFILPKGTTLTQAKEQLAGLEIEYETIPYPLPKVEFSYPMNLAAAQQGSIEMIAQLAYEKNQAQNLIDSHKAEMVKQSPHGIGTIAGKDYEEGVWTPFLFGTTVVGNHTYYIQSGYYTKIGNIAIATFNVYVNVWDINAAGDLKIGGLPIVVSGASSSSHYNAIAQYNNANLPSGHNCFSIQPAQASPNINIINAGASSAGFTSVSVAKNGLTLRGTVIYKIS